MKRILISAFFATGLLVTPMLTSAAGASSNPDHAVCASAPSLNGVTGWGHMGDGGIGQGGLSALGQPHVLLVNC
jgi:hypothetical protein